MKVKKLDRKLSLNKKTIVNLNSSEMNVVKGGDTLDAECPSYTCISCPPNTYKCPTVVIFSCQCVPGYTF